MAVSKVDTTAFNAMCKQGARMTAVPYTDFVKAEVGKVLEATIKFTPALQVAKLRARYDNAIISAQPATLYTPKRPRGNVQITKNGYIKYFLANRYPNELWNAIALRRKQRLQRILGARGLAKRSWLRIAQALGIDVAAPAYVNTAIASTGQEYQDVGAETKVTDSLVAIAISNAQPTVNRIGGAQALARAIAGRVKFFEKNISYRVFNDVAKIARAYPGIKAQLSAN